MKALSIKQPWAELIVSGKKTIELRNWNTNLRGEFLIHASNNPDWNAMKNFGFEDLPRGFIVGKANLIGVKKYKDKDELDKDKHKHLADSSWGDYGFVLEKAEKFVQPIKTKGNLGFWEFESEN